MQSGSVGGSQPQYSIRKPQISYGSAESPAVAPEPEAVVTPEVPKEEVTLAARFKTTTEALQSEDAGNGQLRSKMTIALVPYAKQAELEQHGVMFPEIEEVRSNIGLSPEGRLELVPVDGTGNPETTHILETLEVPKSHLVKDAQGHAPIDDLTAHLVERGSTVIPQGWFGVPEGTAVAPKGYEFKMGTSPTGLATEKKRLRLNNLSDGLGNFAQSSLAGVVNIPYVSAAAPLVALATAGASLNKQYESLKESQDLMHYVQQREKLSKTDMITLEVGVNAAVPVSAEAEKKRLELKIRTAKAKLASTSLLGMAGGSSVIGFMAAGGAFGTGAMAGALTGAVAATPYLAGAAMIIGSGGMVLNSLAELKSLSKEKAELQELQGKGQTHVLKTIEKMNPQIGRPMAVGEQQMPIEERLKNITKEQRKHRLMATGLSGGIGSIALTVGIGASAISMAPLALAPAGVLAAGQSVAKLKELSAEKKELVELHKNGATMTPRQVERQDGSWNEEKIPISTLLKDIERKQKTNKLILTSVGSAAGMFALTLGAGVSMLAAAPIMLIPALVGGLMFPDKVKAFADKVAGFVTGKFGAAASSRKELVAEGREKNEQAKADLQGQLQPLMEKSPELFYVPSDAERKAAAKNGQHPPMGLFTTLSLLMDQYAESGSRVARFEAMQQIESLLAGAPPEAAEAIPGVRARLKELHMDTEAGWVARDVMLEMKKDTTDKVVEDSRVHERLGELGFSTDDLRGQYEQSLYIDHDERKQNELLGKSQAGDRDATLQLARREVFGASRMYFQSQEELGQDLLARLLDGLKRPGDEENLELVIKEVNYKLGRPMAPSTAEGGTDKWWMQESTLGSGQGYNEPLRLTDFSNLANAVATLEKPLDLSAPATPTVPEGPQSRMASAFRELHALDPEGAAQLGQAFATLNSSEAYEGLSPQEAQQKKLQAGVDLTKAKVRLEEKSPELVGLWDKARVDVEEELFQSSIDHEFVGKVLARPEVNDTVSRLGLGPEDAKNLYNGLLRSLVLGDQLALQNQLVDSTGKQIDPRKSELLEVLDRSITSATAEATGGANDTVAPEADLGNPMADPQVATFLQQNPAVGGVLQSPELDKLAGELSLPPEQVREAYLTLVQAQLNPVLTAEFDGRLQAGDVKTAQTFDIGSRVGQLVKAATMPSPEVLAQQLDAVMQGPVANAVLTHPDIVAMGEQLKVDNGALLRTLLTADLAGDPSGLAAIQARAQKGETQAQSELQMIQTLAQAAQHFGQQLAAAQGGGGQPPAPVAA